MSAQILDIENAVAAYLRQDYADFTQNGVNLLRLALNNARKHAERIHDWEVSKGTESVTTSATGTFTLASNIKQVYSFYLVQDGVRVPLRHANQQMAAIWAKERLSKRTIDSSARYLDDNDISYYSNEGYTGTGIHAPYEVFMNGRNCVIYPEPSEAKALEIECCTWMDAYENDADTDFFVEHGSDFLLYAGIVEVNFFNHTFAESQEGNFSPPVRMRDEALASLIEHDNFQIDGQRLIRR